MHARTHARMHERDAQKSSSAACPTPSRGVRARCAVPRYDARQGSKEELTGKARCRPGPHSPITSPCECCCCAGEGSAPNTKAPWAGGAAPKLRLGAAAGLKLAAPPPAAAAAPPNAPQPPPKAGQPKGPMPGCCPAPAPSGCCPTGTWKWLALGPSTCEGQGRRATAVSRQAGRLLPQPRREGHSAAGPTPPCRPARTCVSASCSRCASSAVMAICGRLSFTHL